MKTANRFILALVGVVVLAWLFPGIGDPEGVLPMGQLTRSGVMVIFLLQGLTLKTRQLADGLREWKLHAFVQGWIFLAAALVLLLAGWVLHRLGQPALGDGFFYLALVPTTISSAVAFSSAAGGNVPAAIFNVTVANVFGVVWVPAGCLVLFASSGSLPLSMVGPLLWKVVQLILLPLLVGQVLRPFLHKRAWFQRSVPSFKLVNHGIILFIVFAALCQSFLSDAWSGIGIPALGLLLGITVAAVLIIHAGVWWSSGWMAGSSADRITALFCGSQKTLAAGAPMAVAIFSGNEALGGTNLGLLLLPLLCYHPIQLFLAALLVPKLSSAS